MSVAYCQIARVLWRSDNIPGHTETTNYYGTASCNNGKPLQMAGVALRASLPEHLSSCEIFVAVETPLYLQSVYVHSANWCEDWALWLGEGHSVVPFRGY
jgi:hypothetical protein